MTDWFKRLSNPGALPPGFEGFSDEETRSPSGAEEDWAHHPPLKGLRPGDRINIGRQAFEVVRSFSDYEVMVQKPGAKRKAFNVHQEGPRVLVREQKGGPETTAMAPVVLDVDYREVRR